MRCGALDRASTLGSSGATRRCTRRDFLVALAGSLISGAVPAAAATPTVRERWHERMRPLMGTYVAVGITHRHRGTALALIDDCFEFMQGRIDELSSWTDSSLVARLNKERYLAKRDATTELVALLNQAARLRALSDGAFNLLVKPLTDCWRAAKESGSRPDSGTLTEIRHGVQSSRAVIDIDSIRIEGTGSIDVGGIGKGLIADCAAAFLRARGVTEARIACSGDLRFVGTGPWTVEIEDPRQERSVIETTLVHGSAAISTSGDSRDCWFSSGERLHHLIDPGTGQPGTANRQVTVIASTGLQADGLASALYFLPAERVRAAALSCSDAQALVVDAGGNIHLAGWHGAGRMAP